MGLPLAVIERIMRNAGAKGLSEDAVREMRDSAEDIAGEVIGDAARIAREEGRDTINVEDVERAMES